MNRYDVIDKKKYCASIKSCVEEYLTIQEKNEHNGGKGQIIE